MTTLDFAANQLSSLLPTVRPDAADPAARLRYLSTQIHQCLESDVLPAIASVWNRPSFHDLAKWPHRTLIPGAEGPERQVIEETRLGIQSLIVALRAFISTHRELLGTLLPRRSQLPRQGAALSLGDLDRGLVQATDLCQEEWCWLDDYFGPVHGIFEQVGAGTIQRGEFIIRYNSRLSHVGNHVARCLLVRAESAVNAVCRVEREIRVALVQANQRIGMPWFVAKQSLDDCKARLVLQLLGTDDARLAESAATLVQLYSDYGPASLDLSWLELDSHILDFRRGCVQEQLSRQADFQTSERVAAALRQLGTYYSSQPPAQRELEDAIARKQLVIIEGTREVFWQGQPVQQDWHGQNEPWNLLLTLARSRSYVEPQDLGLERAGRSTLPTRLGRLKRLMPPQFQKYIAPGGISFPGCYKLSLPSSDKSIFPERP